MLKGVLPQLTDEVELVVRDDSPNEETRKVFDAQTRGKNIHFNYVKGEKIGLDAANMFLIEHARGKYVWWFSDDDEMYEGAIAKVVSLVKKYPDIAFMWANYDFAEPNHPALSRDEGFFEDGSDTIETLGTNIGLLSSLIFRRDEALQSLPVMKKHLKGFSFAGLVPPLSILSGTGKFYFLKGPYVLAHPTTSEEFKKAFTKNGVIKNVAFDSYGVDFYRIMREFEGGFRRSAVRNVLAANFASLWRGMAVAWIGGWDTPEGKRWKMFTLYWSFPEVWLAMLVFLLPLPLNRFLYRVYKIFFNRRKWAFGRAGR